MKVQILCGISLLSAYFWYKFYKYKKKCECDLHDKEEFLKRHNCVIMYGKMRMSGWPAYPGRHSPSFADIHTLHEPIVYFISTAQRELRVAVMSLSSGPLTSAIEDVLKRGVKVQLLLHLESELSVSAEKLRNLGAEVQYYSARNIDTIMHYKYAVKDSDQDGGYVLYGSLNWTLKGFTENYEDVVITGNTEVIQAFKRNFNLAWDRHVTLCRDQDYRNKIVLMRHTMQFNDIL